MSRNPSVPVCSPSEAFNSAIVAVGEMLTDASPPAEALFTASVMLVIAEFAKT
jgi:hypothetical protein